MSNRSYEDPVVAEIHAIRDKMVEDCDGDHLKLMQHVREHQKTTCRRVLSAPGKAGTAEQSVGPDGE